MNISIYFIEIPKLAIGIKCKPNIAILFKIAQCKQILASVTSAENQKE